jgi:hypothetical protein
MPAVRLISPATIRRHAGATPSPFGATDIDQHGPYALFALNTSSSDPGGKAQRILGPAGPDGLAGLSYRAVAEARAVTGRPPHAPSVGRLPRLEPGPVSIAQGPADVPLRPKPARDTAGAGAPVRRKVSVSARGRAR